MLRRRFRGEPWASAGNAGGRVCSGGVCWGCWAAAEVLAAEAVAVTLEAEDVGVVDEPVDHGCGDGVVAEDLAPGAEGLVAGDDQAGALVAGADEREHEVRCLGVERDVADLVNHEQRDQREAFEFRLELALALGFTEPGDPCGRGRELHALSCQARPDPPTR